MSTTAEAGDRREKRLTLADIALCFEGIIPAEIATASADGTPNVTHLSRVHMVDDEHVALSNQFFSKTTRNLAENPRACVCLIDPIAYDSYKLILHYERTERRGPLFERLRRDIDAIAALTGMEGVFKLRSADVYRVVALDLVPAKVHLEAGDTYAAPGDVRYERRLDASAPLQLAELSRRLSRCVDLDSLVGTSLTGLAELLGYEHSLLLLLDESGDRLYTIASHGYTTEGIGSEVHMGEGVIGMAASRAEPMRVGNLGKMLAYARTVRRAYEERGGEAPGIEIPLPGLAAAESQVAVPAMVLGQLVGIVAIESEQGMAFGPDDEALLTVVATLVASAIEIDWAYESAGGDRAGEEGAGGRSRRAAPSPSAGVLPTRVRFFSVDGSTFVDGDYLIKGVAGRILWVLLNQYERDGREEFTNKEVRLDPSLELPEYRDNLESRLILLKRRLDERDAPIRIEKTGRGRFHLTVDAELKLESVAGTDAAP